MLRRLVTVLIALSVSAPNLFAEEAAGPIRTSVARVKFDFTPRAVSATTPRLQRRSPGGLRRDSAIVAGLATVGLFAGMVVTSKVALPCSCDDPETVVARGGLVGAAAGAVAGIMITSR